MTTATAWGHSEVVTRSLILGKLPSRLDCGDGSGTLENRASPSPVFWRSVLLATIRHCKVPLPSVTETLVTETLDRIDR
jgi:hypothetical protein